ncbi:hypothetical protein LPJ61_002274 [Coemansia biformis]|uniref:LIM zinc-binding domain-containing protein n=1 Tax=Coemansia biformis TaxID=1286918 RepID=A0A9W7YDM4_9FUNG|nr:hypothetical protein LPJ61_002274 [Coemansia biformis]
MPARHCVYACVHRTAGQPPAGVDASRALPAERARAWDDGGKRPTSMYSGILDAPVQSAIERTVQPQGAQPRSAGHSPAVRSKWSQYFTSTAGGAGSSSAAGSPGNGAALPLSVSGGVSDPRDLMFARPAAATTAAHERPRSSTVGLPAAAPARPSTSDGRAGLPNGGLGSPAWSPDMTRNVASAFDNRKRAVLTNSALDVQRSRSATLPDVAAERPCAVCERMLRTEEQRQFASRPGCVFCSDCYHASYSPGHCIGCGRIVLTHGRPWLRSSGRVWHKLCIKCHVCAKMLITPLVDTAGEPVCEPCFVSRNPGAAPRPMSNDADEHPGAPPSAADTRQRLGLQTGAAMPLSTRPSSCDASGMRVLPPPSSSSPLARHAVDSGAASIPTPAPTECDRAPSGDLCVSPGASSSSGLGNGGARLPPQPRIMSPVEVAEKEGLPLPRHIVDPDMAIVQMEHHAPVGEFDRRGAPQPGQRPRPPPIDTMLLSPSLKNPNTPTTRTASPRSVSFRIDEPPLSLSRATDGSATKDKVASVEKAAPTEKIVTAVTGTAAAKGAGTEQGTVSDIAMVKERAVAVEDCYESPAVAAAPAAQSLADYVLSKATGGTSRPNKLLSVAETIKKFSAGPFSREPKNRASSINRTQLPELQDLIRTHHREPPTEPTVPALHNHSNALKSRPRNSNRRLPQQQQQQQPVPPPRPSVPAAAAERDDSEAPEVSLAPNQCARCTRAIEETWLRLSDGRQVHEECFTCQQCDGLIADGVYVVENNMEFHPQCVPPSPPVVSVSPVPSQLSRAAKPRGPRHEERCSRCGETLSGPRFQLTNGKQYHQECFACAGCSRHFEEGSYVCFEGQEYHHECAEQVVNSRREDVDDAQLVCGECTQAIEGMFLRHNGMFFHPACFCCVDCRRAITPGMPFGEIDARPCCETCLEARASHQQHQHQPHLHQQQHQRQGWAGANQAHPSAPTRY